MGRSLAEFEEAWRAAGIAVPEREQAGEVMPEELGIELAIIVKEENSCETRARAVEVLDGCGWAASRIAETVGCSRQYVSQVRADVRRKKGSDAYGACERIIREVIVPEAVERVREMVTDEGLRKKRPGLVYQISKDALQAVPFQTSRNAEREGVAKPQVVVNVMALPGVNVQVKAGGGTE